MGKEEQRSGQERKRKVKVEGPVKLFKILPLRIPELRKLEFDTRNKSWPFGRLANNVGSFWLRNKQKIARLASNGVNLLSFQVSKG